MSSFLPSVVAAGILRRMKAVSQPPHSKTQAFTIAKPNFAPAFGATVLVGKLKMDIFEEAVHKDDEFAHASSHGDERFFTSGEQALVKIFKNAVVAHGVKGRHVERAADGSASATNGADRLLLTAVPVIRSHPGQSGCGLVVECSQFWHF